MTELTKNEKYEVVRTAFREKVNLWHRRMDRAVEGAEKAIIDEKVPWAKIVAMANLAGGAASLIVPPSAVAWSIPLAILNTASGIAAIPYAGGAKFTNSQMKEIYNNILSGYLQRITHAADNIGKTPHAKALIKGILEIVAADEDMRTKEDGGALIRNLFERSQVIPTERSTVEAWVAKNYTLVYRRTLDVFKYSPQSKIGSLGKIFVKGGGPYIELFPSESAFNEICLSHDFTRDDIGNIFSEQCNEPIIGALIKSNEQFVYLITNIWKFKLKRHQSASTQRVITPGMAPMNISQAVTHLEIAPLPRSRPLGGTVTMWKQGVEKDLSAIRAEYVKMKPLTNPNPDMYRYTG